MVYFTRLWQRVFHFTSLPLQLERWLFGLPKGWKISFSFGVKYTMDSPGLPPNAVSGNRFVRHPLDDPKRQIRLLEILPGNPEDNIRTSPVTVHLQQAPPFEALSYVWGGYMHSYNTLEVNGQDMMVTENLFDAIQTLRLPDSPRLIWADAICINQNDNREKGPQVQIMGQIYAAASNVVAYLGRSGERTEMGMQCLKFFLEPNERSQESPWSFSETTIAGKNIEDILTRTWFERIWTVQEATLARNTTLVCGPHQISWPSDLQTLRRIVFRMKTAAISPFFSIESGYIDSLDWAPLLNILEAQMRQAA